MIFKLILIAFVLIAIAFAAIGIKMFVKKDGEFKKQCSSVDANGNRIGCTCKKPTGEVCENS